MIRLRRGKKVNSFVAAAADKREILIILDVAINVSWFILWHNGRAIIINASMVISIVAIRYSLFDSLHTHINFKEYHYIQKDFK